MKWMPVLLLVCGVPLQMQAQPVTLDLKAEPQKKTQWCWVATSRMAINSFPETIDSINPNKKFRHLTQFEVYARSFHGKFNLKDEFPQDPVKAQQIKNTLENRATTCENPTLCNRRGQPMLYDIDSDKPPNNQALSMAAIKLDIDGKPAGLPPGKGNGHPIIIQWRFGPPGKEPFAHVMIITGYDDQTNQLLIYDPLPELPIENSGDDLHERWISYATYVDPANYLGLAISALHQKDQYRMRRMGAAHPVPKPLYTLVPAQPGSSEQPAPGNFEPAKALQEPIDAYMRSRKGTFLHRDGSPRKGELSTGRPVPVVALSARQLSDSPPESLLEPRANAHVVPVLEYGKVVDSFLLLPNKRRWQQGGYSNNQITHLLTALSEKHKGLLPEDEVFYLVSIPEMAAYFIAYGFNERARLLSLHRPGGQFEDAKCAIDQAIADFYRAQEESMPHQGK